MRPNWAQDPPPASIEVGGYAYPVQTDFRVWLDVLGLLRQIDHDAQTEDEKAENARVYLQIEQLVFGGHLDEEAPEDVLRGVTEFLAGYPSAPVQSSAKAGARTFSYDYDLNEILMAIRDQHGVDLSWRNKDGCHWWEFLLYFHTLAGDHVILNLMDVRGYDGKDKEMLKRKRQYALPEELTKEDKAEQDALRALFG